MNHIDDCLVHGAFMDKAAAMACIGRLQKQHPADTFGHLAMPLDTQVRVGFNTLSNGWHWVSPALPSEADSDSMGSLQLPDTLTSNHSFDIIPHANGAALTNMRFSSRMSAPCNAVQTQ